MANLPKNIAGIIKSLLIVVLVPAFSTQVEAAVTFEFKSSYTTTSDEIFLGDLVKNITLPAEYAQIPLGLAPFKKNERVIEAAFIRESLIRQQKTAYLPTEKGSVTVRNITRVLTAAEQEKMITAVIDTLMRDESYKLELKNKLKDVVYPTRDKIEITLLDKDRVRKSGNQLFQIEIKLNERIFTKISVNSFIRLYRKVLVSTEKSLPNDMLDADGFQLQEKEVTGFENELVKSYEELAGYKAARLIPPGSILRKSLLKPIPIIKRGEIVSLTAKDDRVEISLPATALFDCQNGQIVKFKINATAAVVSAEVTGPGRVLLRR